MNMSPFGKRGFKSQSAARPLPSSATLTDFSAGLNLVDSDASLKTNSSKVLINMHRDADGGMSLRWGTKFSFDVSSVVSGNVIEILDFAGSFVCFTDTGEVAAYNITDGPSAIWNDAKANDLVGHPDGWSTGLVSIDYTDFKNQLIVLNGVDKPILIKSDLTVNYLQDIPTGSNVNTPVGRYCTTVNNYVVIAGVVSDKSSIYISAKGASGTWPGDTAPNDAVSINVATYAPQSDSDILGISSFRNFLLVHFEGLTVPIQLGTYDSDGNHNPTVTDVIPDYGIISHRMFITLATEIIFADARGVYSAKRNLFGNALEASFLSQKITPLFTTDTVAATNFQSKYKSFAVYNKLEQRIMFFIRSGNDFTGYVFSFIDGLQRPAWSVITGFDFDCGCTTKENRVFFAKGSKVYQYGNNVFEGEAYDGDLIADSSGEWTTGIAYTKNQRVTYGTAVYKCLVAHTSSGSFSDDLDAGKWVLFVGNEIDFDWELPWSDFSSRTNKKKLTHIMFDTERSGKFTCEIYVDDIYKNKQTGAYDPALSMEFVGAASGGFGSTPSQGFGGGRRTSDERLWGNPVDFKKAKLRLFGSTLGGLKIDTISLLYIKGKFQR